MTHKNRDEDDSRSEVKSPKGPKRGSELLEGFLAPRASVKERLAAGKALRDSVPRKSLAAYAPYEKRQDPISLLETQNKTRLQNLVPVRFARMLTSPFAFLRGSALVMAADLAPSSVTGIRVHACGDMHVSNFGVYASAERNLVFSINDFDEAFSAPWEWDLKRLAASAAVAARFLRGDKVDAEGAARAVVESYRQHMQEYAWMGYVETWYATIKEKDVFSAFSPRERDRVGRVLAKAKQRGHLQVLAKMTDLVDDRHLIVEDPPLIVRETHTENGRPIVEAFDIFLQSYLESLTWDRRRLLGCYRILDAARKVVGVGSVGTRCWVILMQGRDAEDPLFLQVKEAQPSVLQKHAGSTLPFRNEGQRVVVGQRMIQGSPDIFLGWGQMDGREFYVRQLRDMKGSAELVPGESSLSRFTEYCGLCGWGLALAHAKSGDAAMIAGYMGKSEALDEAMAEFAIAYANQTKSDYEALVAAAKQKRIPVAKES